MAGNPELRLEDLPDIQDGENGGRAFHDQEEYDHNGQPASNQGWNVTGDLVQDDDDEHREKDDNGKNLA
jgi:hypothetical protein